MGGSPPSTTFSPKNNSCASSPRANAPSSPPPCSKYAAPVAARQSTLARPMPANTAARRYRCLTARPRRKPSITICRSGKSSPNLPQVAAAARPHAPVTSAGPITIAPGWAPIFSMHWDAPPHAALTTPGAPYPPWVAPWEVARRARWKHFPMPRRPCLGT